MCISQPVKILGDRMKKKEKVLCHCRPEKMLKSQVPQTLAQIPGQHQEKSLPQNTSMPRYLTIQFLMGEDLLLEDSDVHLVRSMH